MTQGIYNIDTDIDCQRLKTRMESIYERDFDYYDSSNNHIGFIWLYVKYGYTNYIREVVNEELYSYDRIIYPITMGSTISYQILGNPDSVYGTTWGLDPKAYNLDGSVTQLYSNDDMYPGRPIEIEFYLCGCSDKDIRCGNCCVNCCDIATLVKEGYQNMLE